MKKLKNIPNFIKIWFFNLKIVKQLNLLGRTFLNFKKTLIWTLKLTKFKNIKRQYKLR